MKTEKDNKNAIEMQEISIPGINTTAGIKQCGNIETYLELLSDIYGIIDKKSAETERFLAEGDLRAFTTNVHSLKTTCRMLGHSGLSESFFELEQIGKEGDEKKAKELTPDVLERFRSLKPLLEPYLPKESAEKVPFSAEEATALLSQLEAAAGDFDINAAEEAMNGLLAFECDKELADGLNSLAALVNDLEYDDVCELAKELKNIILSR